MKVLIRAACAALVALSSVHVAHASGCNDIVRAAIRFKPGSSCWSYEGKATQFDGSFAAGQQVRVEMSGVASFSDGRNGSRTRWEPRMPQVTGPGRFMVQSEGGTLAFRTPAAGRYEFNFYPCAMWGGFGRVRICTG